MRGVRGTAKARPNKAQLATAKGRKTFRWPEEIRVKMAVALIGQLSMSEVMAVRDGGDLPTRHGGPRCTPRPLTLMLGVNSLVLRSSECMHA